MLKTADLCTQIKGFKHILATRCNQNITRILAVELLVKLPSTAQETRYLMPFLQQLVHIWHSLHFMLKSCDLRTQIKGFEHFSISEYNHYFTTNLDTNPKQLLGQLHN